MIHPYQHINIYENCSGCGLCANVCSKSAIRMVWSQQGFLIPLVDTELCINCGLCVKQCIALEEPAEYADNIESVVSFGGWHKEDSIHRASSSGGIFSALAQYTISAGGCVFGVVWQDKTTAVFAKAETMEGVKPMRGSKYTPAMPGMVYREVLAELKRGRQVLFSGTPCQVHALRKYLRKPFEKLLTVDIVCHGAPSHLILEQYVQEAEKRTGKCVDFISFRDKPEGWLRFHVTKHYVDGSSESAPLDKDIYMNMFLCDKALNQVCYNCPYSHIPRQGDITLGDYWGVERFHSDWPIEQGVSAILANSQKGEGVLAHLADSLELKKEPFQTIYKGQNVPYVRPVTEIPYIRNLVLKKIGKWSLSAIYNRLVHGYKLGPIYISRKGIINNFLISLHGVARCAKKKTCKIRDYIF